MNTLIADSGATSTDWCITLGGEVVDRFSGSGISPVFQTEEEIAEEVRQQVIPRTKNLKINSIYFYGAGCTAEKAPLVKRAFSHSFPIDSIHVYSDIIAAAHSLCGHEPGIACILGTGSNSCEWDGEKVVKQVSPLGFILGDEGSGASLGKQLIGNALKGQLTPGLKEKLLEKYKLTTPLIIEKVYHAPFPNRFLASLSPFLKEHINDKTIRSIVIQSFSDFFHKHVMQYNYKKNRVNFVGSVAFHYSSLVREVAGEMGIEVGKIIQSPMEGLIEYYK